MRFERYFYNPANPLGKSGRRVTESKKHLAVAKELAVEGTVLLKNDGTLPLQKGEKLCVFGRGAGEWIFDGGRCSGYWEQNNGILKGEWNYHGLVMTDWWPHSLLQDDLYGGNDVRIPGVLSSSFPGSPSEYDPCRELENGTLDWGAALELPDGSS